MQLARGAARKLTAFCIVLCFAEVGSRFKETGGPYLYARVAFGPLIGFEVGWLMWLARLTARHLPFALLTGIAVVVVIYVLIQVVCIGTLPDLAGSERPLSDASLLFLGGSGASLIAAGALVSVTGSMNGVVLVASRVLFAMAEQRQLPGFLVKIHSRFHTPHVAILLSAIFMLGLTLSSTFVSAVTVSALIRLVTYVATCAALPALRWRRGMLPAAFVAPWGWFLSGTGLVFSVWLLSNSSWDEARVVGIASALGVLVHLTCAPRRQERLQPHVTSNRETLA